MLDDAGFRGFYDFLHLPIDFKTGANFGYALINMANVVAAESLWAKFSGFTSWGPKSTKVCRLVWAERQGRENMIQRYRDSPMQHPAVPQMYRPALFQEGKRVPFPPPTRHIKAPRWLKRQ